MTSKLPVLSDDALIGLPGAVVNAWTGSTVVSREALLGTFLVYAGNQLGNEAFSKYMSGTKHPPRLFGLIVGSSGAGKGTSLGEVVALDRAVADLGGIMPHFVGNSEKGIVSGAAFVDAVASRGDSASTLLVEPEFSRLSYRVRLDESLSTHIMAAYDDGHLKHKVKKKGGTMEVWDAHVSILGHVVPYVLRSQFRDKEFANGFANRFLYFYTRPVFDEKAYETNPDLVWGGVIDPEVWQSLTVRLNAHFKNAFKGELTWEPAAKALWRDFVVDRRRIAALRPDLEEPTVLDKMREPREFAHVTRLAVLYALLDESNQGIIRKSHLDAALAIWNYSLSSIDFIWGLNEAVSADTLLAFLQEQFVATNGAWLRVVPVKETLYGTSPKQKAAFESDLAKLVKDGVAVTTTAPSGSQGGVGARLFRLSTDSLT